MPTDRARVSREDRDQDTSPSDRLKLVMDGAAGRIEWPPNRYLVEGVGGRDVFVIHLNQHGAFCDRRVSGKHRLERLVERALHNGGAFVVDGRSAWPGHYGEIYPEESDKDHRHRGVDSRPASEGHARRGKANNQTGNGESE